MRLGIRPQVAILIADLCMVALAWFGAYWLRFNLDTVPAPYLQGAFYAIPVVLLVQGFFFKWFGVDKGVWRYSSLSDLVRIVKAVFVATGIAMAVLFLGIRLEHVPRSVPVLYVLLLLLMLGGPRFLYRWLKYRKLADPQGRRVMIVGAGQAGEMLARDFLGQETSHYQPVVFVDDKRRRHGQEVHGIPVLGGVRDIPTLADQCAVDLIVIAIPSASAAEMKAIVELCEQTGREFRTVPNLAALVSGELSVNELREVSIDDLLGREAISLDWEAIRAGISGHSVLVTGGGGSIGSELCRQIVRLEPARLVVLDNNEFNLYQIERELQAGCASCVFHLGDVTDAAAVQRVFSTYKPNVVFHAAAYKHVPLLEDQIRQAVRNNVQGTRTVAEAAHASGAGKFVLISTDKAVNPANIMGATKRVAEIFCQWLDARSATEYITVRFGNVLGSRGSVVPLFREQIAAGGPVTVTDPQIERFFMTIPEACQLILQASVVGKGGDILVLDMGRPVKIRDLAEQMIKLSGKVPGKDIEIRYVGLRPGEKLYEELFHENEALSETTHPKVLRFRHREQDAEVIAARLGELQQSIDAFDDEAMFRRLNELVPENTIRHD